MGGRGPVIVFALFPGGLALDFVGPHMVFSRIPGAHVLLASTIGGEIRAEGGSSSADCIAFPRSIRATSSALPAGLASMMPSSTKPSWRNCVGSLRQHASSRRCAPDRWHSVRQDCCNGKRAACHWFAREFLTAFGATPDLNRVARDGDVITSGGVTAGIDFALSIAAELIGSDTAQEIQLQIEYAPAPPFNAGTPETAPLHILSNVSQRYVGSSERRRAAVKIAAARFSEQVPS